MFSHLIGNPLAKHLLAKMLQEKKIPSTLLFSGHEGVGKCHFAKAFAKKLLGEGYKSDCMILQPEEKSELHTVESMRHMIQEAALPPLESSKRVFLIDDADKMLPPSSNTLLKTLEEPPSHALFILIVHDASMLLPTIVSRSRRVDFSPIPAQELTEYLCKSLNQSLDEAIPRSVENVTFDKASAPGLQQAKLMSKQLMCKHMGDADSCKDGDAGAVTSDVFNRSRYEQIAARSEGSFALAKKLCEKVYDPLINHFREWLEKKDGKILDKIEEIVSTGPQADFLFGLMIEELQAKNCWNERNAKFILDGHQAWQRHVKIKTILNWMQLQ